MDEGTFDLPTGFVDKTVHFFEAPAHAIGLVWCRLPLPGDATSLREAVEAYVGREARKVLRHRVIAIDEVDHAGRVYLEVATTHREGRTDAFQRQAHRVEGATWVVVTATGPAASRRAVDACLARVLDSYRPRS